jgi:hypothetical protein
MVGVVDHSFGNFKLNLTAPLGRVDGGLRRETTRRPADWELVVGPTTSRTWTLATPRPSPATPS